MRFNHTPTAILAVLGFALSVAAVFLLLPAGLFWATLNADAQVVAVRNLPDLPPVRVVGAPQVLNVDPKHRTEQQLLKP